MVDWDLEGIEGFTTLDDLRELAQSHDLTLSETAQLVERVLGYVRALKLKTRRILKSSAGKLSEEEAIERALAELSIPSVDMLVKDIISVRSPTSSPLLEARKMVRLPFQFYQALFNELETYINEFTQLSRDYSREIRGQELFFAVDFSELHNYMYPYRSDSPRSKLNKYVLDTAEDFFTLLPGAAGELLTDLERALPSDEVLEHDPLEVYEAVHRFVSEFPTARDNQERIIALYGEAETQLRQAWGELLNVVIQGVGRTSFAAVKDLMDKGRLAPIQGVQEITGSLPPDVRRLAQRVKRDLYSSRPARERNNQVDTIDFTVTLLLNQQEQDRRERYISIYTQSWALIRACTARKQLRWDDDFLVRGAQYFKFRTRLQELFPSSVEGRLQFVEEWREECRKLQRAVTNLVDLETELPALTQPTLELLELFRRFDEECRIPLSFVGKTAEQEEPVSRQKAERLYNTLRDSGEFRGKTEDAYRVLKAYLQDLHECLGLFVPEAAKTEDAKEYMEALLEWLDLEEIERDKD